jgi:hypothetical protein
MLTDPQLVPYLTELERAVAAALSHFERLEEAASAWVAIRKTLQSPLQSAPSRFTDVQQTAFDALEAFLASWARTSLLVYPTSQSPFGQARGTAMRESLQLPDETLDNRMLRDSWVHCDERIDAMVSRGHLANLQRFLLSGEVTEVIIGTTPRVLIMDTLRVFYRTRDGDAAHADLRVLQAALLAAQSAVENVYLRLLDTPPE